MCFNVFFHFTLHKKVRLSDARTTSTKDKEADNQNAEGKEQFRIYLDKLDVFKSAEEDKIRAKVIKEIG